MNNKQLDKLIRERVEGRWAMDGGLYFRISSSGTASWQIRYTSPVNQKRLWFTLEGVYPYTSIAQAKAEAAQLKVQIKSGFDPLLEKKRAEQETIKTVNHLFNDWFEHDVERRIKNTQIPKRIYFKEIAPFIGDLAVVSVNPRDIRAILHAVATSGRNAVANDALNVCKQLFKHAIKLNLIDYSPAQAFTMSDAGGAEKSRERYLELHELEKVFTVLKQHQIQFTRDNYLAFALLLTLGVRKNELIAARWDEFNFQQQFWLLPAERTKTSTAICIPLPSVVVDWLMELKVRACGSDYLFPSRRSSKRREYISSDTLNHALAKMFGQKVDSNKQPTPDYIGQAGVSHFTIHDLRRTCRSLLASIGIQSHVAERCLNHKLKGVEGIYNRHDYLDERRDALNQLSDLLAPIINTRSEV
jgi:integrase